MPERGGGYKPPKAEAPAPEKKGIKERSPLEGYSFGQIQMGVDLARSLLADGLISEKEYREVASAHIKLNDDMGRPQEKRVGLTRQEEEILAHWAERARAIGTNEKVRAIRTQIRREEAGLIRKEYGADVSEDILNSADRSAENVLAHFRIADDFKEDPKSVIQIWNDFSSAINNRLTSGGRPSAYGLHRVERVLRVVSAMLSGDAYEAVGVREKDEDIREVARKLGDHLNRLGR